MWISDSKQLDGPMTRVPLAFDLMVVVGITRGLDAADRKLPRKTSAWKSLCKVRKGRRVALGDYKHSRCRIGFALSLSFPDFVYETFLRGLKR